MKHAAALERAGISAERRGPVLGKLERIFGVYERRQLQPKDSVETLARVESAATKLRGLIKSLSDDVQFSLGLVTDIHEEDMLQKLVERAKLLQQNIRKPVGRQRDALDGLLFDLVEVWRHEMPGHAGIKQDAIHTGDGYSGPLLEFACELLTVENIGFTSRAMLGRRLTAVMADTKPVASHS